MLARLLLLSITSVLGTSSGCETSTCYGNTCDFWIMENGYTCADAFSWSCNCDGCDSCGPPAPPPLPYWTEYSSGEYATEQAALLACTEQSDGLGVNGSTGFNMSVNIILDADSPAAPFFFTDAAAQCPDFSGSGPVRWLRLNDARPGQRLSLTTCDPDSPVDTDLAVFRGGCDALQLVNCSGDAVKVDLSTCQRDHSELSFVLGAPPPSPSLSPHASHPAPANPAAHP